LRLPAVCSEKKRGRKIKKEYKKRRERREKKEK